MEKWQRFLLCLVPMLFYNACYSEQETKLHAMTDQKEQSLQYINVALNKPASQSSTGWEGTAERAVDGNTDGNFKNGSVTHTMVEKNPFWQVDLLHPYIINQITIWNRTDCCPERLSNFIVQVLDQHHNLIRQWHYQDPPNPKLIINTGDISNVRYVDIQLKKEATNAALSIAEVQVNGKDDIWNRTNEMVCSLVPENKFEPAKLWTNDYRDAQGWDQHQYYHTLRLGDINGDGKADICGRGGGGISCSLSDGNKFEPAKLW